MQLIAYVEIVKQRRRAFIRVTSGEVAIHKLYNGIGDAAAEAECLGLVDHCFAQTMPKYGISFRGNIRDIDQERLLQIGFKPTQPRPSKYSPRVATSI